MDIPVLISYSENHTYSQCYTNGIDVVSKLLVRFRGFETNRGFTFNYWFCLPPPDSSRCKPVIVLPFRIHPRAQYKTQSERMCGRFWRQRPCNNTRKPRAYAHCVRQQYMSIQRGYKTKNTVKGELCPAPPGYRRGAHISLFSLWTHNQSLMVFTTLDLQRESKK